MYNYPKLIINSVFKMHSFLAGVPVIRGAPQVIIPIEAVWPHQWQVLPKRGRPEKAG